MMYGRIRYLRQSSSKNAAERSKRNLSVLQLDECDFQNDEYTPPNNMSREDFETTMVENFVKETHYQQYHQCRALAFQADIMRRQGKFEEAISVIDAMKSIYDPQLHSRVLVKNT